MSTRQTLSLKKPIEDSPPVPLPTVQVATEEQVLAFLRRHGLSVVRNEQTIAPPTGEDVWKYEAPIVVEHNDYSHIPPPGERGSIPLQVPAKTWGNPNLLRSTPVPGPQPAHSAPRGR